MSTTRDRRAARERAQRDQFKVRACVVHSDLGERFAITRRPIVDLDAEPLVLRDDFGSIDAAQEYADDVNRHQAALWNAAG